MERFKMNTFKITEGYVSQEFDENGKCISQKFVAQNGSGSWEDETGVPLEQNDYKSRSDWYQPFEMVQPNSESPALKACQAVVDNWAKGDLASAARQCAEAIMSENDHNKNMESTDDA